MEGNSLVSNDDLTRIAVAVRNKTRYSDQMTVFELEDKIREIPPDYSKFDDVILTGYVSAVPNEAFESANLNVGRVSLPECESVDSYAFNSVCFPTLDLPKCTFIGYQAFSQNSCLTSINIPKCQRLEDSAFQDCSNLSSVSLPECTSIGIYAFAYCHNLRDVELPVCTRLDIGTFYSCEELRNVYAPECIEVGYGLDSEYPYPGTFEYCRNLQSISLPKCKYLYSNTFNNCQSLTDVNLPECTDALDYVFADCSSLTYISLPKCTYIGGGSFSGCRNIMNVVLDSYDVFGSSDSSGKDPVEAAKELCAYWGLTNPGCHVIFKDGIEITIE